VTREGVTGLSLYEMRELREIAQEDVVTAAVLGAYLTGSLLATV